MFYYHNHFLPPMFLNLFLTSSKVHNYCTRKELFKEKSQLFLIIILMYLFYEGLPDASVDVVIASQSFHWFANSTALEEIHRVLVPDGSFGIIWAIPDFSIPWMEKLWEFMSPIYKEKSIVLPFDEEWKNVFGLTPRKFFSDLEENLSFRLSLPSSFDEGYKVFASSSVIASGNESTKESFRDLFEEIMTEAFKDKGIAFDHVPFQIFMYWCHKLN